jgi:hypothetical protein
LAAEFLSGDGIGVVRQQRRHRYSRHYRFVRPRHDAELQILQGRLPRIRDIEYVRR